MSAPRAEGSVGPASPPPAHASRYGWIVGVVVVVILAYITLNTVRTKGAGSTGPPAGRNLPAFAVPRVDGTLPGDANVTAGGPRAACGVRLPGSMNSCALSARAPLVLAFVASPVRSSLDQLDVMERIRRVSPGVAFAAVGVRKDRRALARLQRSHGWRFPVGFDRDGAVANAYGVAVFPTITLALPGGRVLRTRVELQDQPALMRDVAALGAAARRDPGG